MVSMPVFDIFYHFLLIPENWAHWLRLNGDGGQIRPAPYAGNKVMAQRSGSFPADEIGK
jgi:hypothetical protein